MKRSEQVNSIMARVRAERERHAAAMDVLRADRAVVMDMPSVTYSASHKRQAGLARVRARAVAELERHRSAVEDLRSQLLAVRAS